MQIFYLVLLVCVCGISQEGWGIKQQEVNQFWPPDLIPHPHLPIPKENKDKDKA